MIYTVTLNPALDYVLTLDALEPGTSRTCRDAGLFFGGKGVNVSSVLKVLGHASVALGFVAGFTGHALRLGLEAQGIATDFISLSRGLTRINVKIKAREETELNGPGPAPEPEQLTQLLGRMDRLESGDCLVLSGSVPPGVPQDFYGTILARLKDRGVAAAVDAAGSLLSAALPCRPFLIKPNLRELEGLLGQQLTREEQILSGVRRLQDQGARNVLVSMAGAGSLLVEESGRSHRLGVPKGTLCSSVGAGDSMVAGFLAGWLETGDCRYAHRLGAAAGAATAFSPGLATKEAIDALLSQDF